MIGKGLKIRHKGNEGFPYGYMINFTVTSWFSEATLGAGSWIIGIGWVLRNLKFQVPHAAFFLQRLVLQLGATLWLLVDSGKLPLTTCMQCDYKKTSSWQISTIRSIQEEFPVANLSHVGGTLLSTKRCISYDDAGGLPLLSKHPPGEAGRS